MGKSTQCSAWQGFFSFLESTEGWLNHCLLLQVFPRAVPSQAASPLCCLLPAHGQTSARLLRSFPSSSSHPGCLGLGDICPRFTSLRRVGVQQSGRRRRSLPSAGDGFCNSSPALYPNNPCLVSVQGQQQPFPLRGCQNSCLVCRNIISSLRMRSTELNLQ